MCSRRFALALVYLLVADAASAELCSNTSVPEVRYCAPDFYCCEDGTKCCPKDTLKSDLTVFCSILLMAIIVLLFCAFKRKFEALLMLGLNWFASLYPEAPSFSDLEGDLPPSYDEAIKMSPPNYDNVECECDSAAEPPRAMATPGNNLPQPTDLEEGKSEEATPAENAASPLPAADPIVTVTMTL